MLTFAKLKRFLLEKIKPQANFQSVMIKTLQENVVAVPKPLLQQTKGVRSNETTEKYFEIVPIYSALEGQSSPQRR